MTTIDLDAGVDAVDLRKIQVELARRSLADFARLVAPSSFIYGASHVAIFEFIERLIDGENGTFTKGQVNLAPRLGKSQIASVILPAYLIGRYPNRRIIALCNNLDLTRQFAEQLVALLQSEEFKEIFPWVEILDISANRINYRDRRQEKGEWGRYFVTSIKRATSGHGAHFLIVDDPLTEQDANSKQIKDGIWNKWTGGFTTRLDPQWNRVLLLGTRWARDDLFGRVIAQSFDDEASDMWEVFKVPIVVSKEEADKINAAALRDPIFKAELEEGRVKLLTPGGTCAPERFSMDFVEKKRAELPAEQYSALYLQSPTPETGSIYRTGMFVGLSKTMLAEARKKIHYRIMVCDLALKADERHDYSAALLIGVVPHTVRRGGTDYVQNSIIIERAWQARVEAADVVYEIKRLYVDWKPNQILIEDAASGIQAIQQLNRAGFPVIAFNPRRLPKGKSGKEERALLAAMMIAQSPIFYDEKDAEIVAARQQCMPAGTEIITVDGLRNIEDVQVGDLVLTHRGRWMPVTKTFRGESCELVTMKAKSLDAITLTPGHPVYGVNIGFNKAVNGGPDWIAARDVQPRPTRVRVIGDKTYTEAANKPHMGIILPTPTVTPGAVRSELDLTIFADWATVGGNRRSICRGDDTITTTHPSSHSIRRSVPLDYRFGRLMGLWLAEGSLSEGGDHIRWSFCAADEQHLVDEVRGTVRDYLVPEASLRVDSRSGSFVVSLNCGALGLHFKEFGRLQGDRRLPRWVWGAPQAFRDGLIDGYFEGDGHVDKKGYISAATISRNLAWGMRLLLLQKGETVTLSHRPAKESYTFPNGECATREAWEIVRYPCRTKNGTAIPLDDGSWVHSIGEVSKTTTTTPTAVYNIEVAEDHSYTTTGGCVHNCLEFPRSDHDDLVDCLTSVILYLRRGNEFDSSFDTMADGIETMRSIIDKDDEDEGWAPADRWSRDNWRGYGRMPGEAKSIADQHRAAREAATIDPFDAGFEYTD
ncbi:MAG: hypothetical protein CTY20_00770 [Hyphomicrobium sp.]|nr:MAG: hypothetical protein CTY20_00770 [Hyphomicrobium sp.]